MLREKPRKTQKWGGKKSPVKFNQAGGFHAARRRVHTPTKYLTAVEQPREVFEETVDPSGNIPLGLREPTPVQPVQQLPDAGEIASNTLHEPEHAAPSTEMLDVGGFMKKWILEIIIKQPLIICVLYSNQ